MAKNVRMPEVKKYTRGRTMPPRADGQPNTIVQILKHPTIELIAMAGNVYDGTLGNRLDFPAQAIRIIREIYIKQFAKNLKNTDIVITLALMNANPSYYTPDQIELINDSINAIMAEVQQEQLSKSSIGKILDIRLCEFTTGIDAVTSYINQGLDYPRSEYKIARLDIFSHGLPGEISLGYGLPALAHATNRYTHPVFEAADLIIPDFINDIPTRYRLNAEKIRQWDFLAFRNDAVFHSWACRTGAPIEITQQKRQPTRFPETEPILKYQTITKPSLAEEIAEHLQIPVHCFKRRSDYSDTWGNANDRQFLDECLKKISLPESDQKKCDKLKKEDKNRKENRRQYRAVWMNNGAVYPVKCGTTPSETPSGRFVFAPDKEPVLTNE